MVRGNSCNRGRENKRIVEVDARMKRESPSVVSKAVGFPVGQSWGELEILSRYARGVPPELSIIDIGTRNGGSAIVLAMSSQSPVYTIDILEDPRESGFGYGEIPPLREHFDSFPFGDRIHIVTCVSSEYVHKGPPIGLVFIDGDHTFKGVEADWLHFYPMLENMGFMICHDYDQPAFPGVTEFLDKLGSQECVDFAETTVVFQKGRR
jgi:predicted O-methyltransferase YrrM